MSIKKESPISENPDSFKQQFNSLDNSQHTILAIIAIHTAPIKRDVVRDLCLKMGKNTTEHRIIIDQLEKAGWIEVKEPLIYCVDKLREAIIKILVETGEYSKLAGILFAKVGQYFANTYKFEYSGRILLRPKTSNDFLREFRHALIVPNAACMRVMLRDIATYNDKDNNLDQTIQNYCTNKETKIFFEQTDLNTRLVLGKYFLIQAIKTLNENYDPLWDNLVQTLLDNDSVSNDSTPDFLFEILMLDYAFITAKIDDTRLDQLKGGFIVSLLAGYRDFFTGKYESASVNYRAARKLFYLNTIVTAKTPLPYLAGIFHALAELQSGNQQTVINTIKAATVESHSFSQYNEEYSYQWRLAWKLIDSISQRVTGQRPEIINVLESKNGGDKTPVWVLALLSYYEKIWFRLDNEIKYVFVGNSKKTAAFPWVTAEFLDVTNESGLQSIINSAMLKNFRTKKNSVPLRGLFSYRNTWELILESLQTVVKTKTGNKVISNDNKKKSRLIWRVSVELDNAAGFYPYEQTWDKKSQSWTLGKAIALSKLFRYQNKLNFLTPQDREICSVISVRTCAHSKPEYYFTTDAGEKFVGHPLLFSFKDPAMRVEFVQGHGEISMAEKNGKLLVTFSPPLKSKDRNYYSTYPRGDEDREFFIICETLYRFKFVHLSKQEIQFRKILGERGHVFPKEAESALTDLMGKLAGLMTVKTDTNIEFANIPEVVPDSKLYIYLTPQGNGIQVEIFVKPFGNNGVIHRPGLGSERIIAEVAGKNLQTVRNLAKEVELRNNFVTKINAFQFVVSSSKNRYIFETPSDALAFLSELKELDKTQNTPPNITKKKKRGKKKTTETTETLPDLSIDFEVYWPQGERFAVSSATSFSNVNLSFSKIDDWLSVEGSFSVDGQNIDLIRVLELLEDNTDDRFVKLDDKNFLTLTNDLRKRLGELKRLSQSKGNSLRIHPFVAAGMDDFFNSIPTLSRNTVWNDVKKRIVLAKDYQTPFPKGFVGDLRDYQFEGYAWLARCAMWGVGCCLADDMGLGKTIQALALLLLRADLGAALVVSPTSVCFNWEREAQRFAPSLNIKRIQPISSSMSSAKKERDELIFSGGKHDVLITSYSLLQQEIELFSQVKYATVILDESQAIKNPDSQRAKAATMLQSNFRVGMTGTPIENNLIELWSLFRFLNPGLLGSQKFFEERFAIPIQREASSTARSTLRKLVHPFILRRTKSQVLEELPARTEIIKEIELSQDEALLYEAARTKAILELQDLRVKKTGHERLQVLAALTRLRQICCNPRLVLPDCGIESSKLEVFRNIMLELQENRHKVLVFSQFVKHLDILQEELKSIGISYQYLDGSVPERERQKRVDAFQSGDYDAFLISIKAGGSGLNLTTADYVIHTDPWWNPAVEDQATDRAHRIGQTRPVTVYRLITKGTIEEKIVRLHHEKRDLADKLLEGADQMTKLSADELLEILIS
ncbi:MAG: DEAD/DEAH box helicase [Planctomycetaceae bacterium]|jgi:SNF2 family DNA or RNA helicase|nr:DEAD/DEAH box helicase [Planctomycetaceae bacterium]